MKIHSRYLRNLKTYYFVLVFLSIVASSCNEKLFVGDLVISNTNIVDVASGKILKSQDVVIKADTIVYIVDHSSKSIQTDETVDGTGKFLIPGLWDMHTHTSSIPITRDIFFPLFIANGVTGIRNMKSDCFGLEQPDCISEAFADPLPSIFEIKAWRSEIEAGTLIGPRIVAGSAMLDGPGDEASSPFNPGTPEHAREHARILKERGVDFAKIYNFIPRDAYFAFAEEAKRIGLPFAGHVPEGVKASEASELGQRSIEHAVFTNLGEECSEYEDEIRRRIRAEFESEEPQILPIWLDIVESYDENKCAKVFEILKENGTYFTPTLISAESDHSWREDPRLRFLPLEEREFWIDMSEGADAMGIITEQQESLIRFQHDVTMAMHRVGVPMLAGSDSGTTGVFTGFGLHDELEVLVAIGFTELEALRTATLEPAKYLTALETQGTVEVGKVADLVLLNANPLEDITNTQKIEAVMANGRYFDRKSLDEILKKVASEAQKN